MRKLFSFALVALVCAAFTSCGGNSDPGEVALNGYKAYMEGGDVTKYLAPDAKNAEAFAEMAKQVVETMKQMNATIDKVELVSVEENGDKATATLSQTITMGGQTTTENVPVPLVKVDDEWYMATEQ